MKRWLKYLGFGVLGILVLGVVVVGAQLMMYGRAENTVYSVAPVEMVASTDSAVLARGEHIASSIGGCRSCHRPDLSGGLVEDMGPIGSFHAPNLTRGKGGVGDTYTDATLARAIRYGIRADGRSLRFMPTAEHHWWPDADLLAVVSYVRSVPPVDTLQLPTKVGPLGKMLNQFGVFKMFSATTVDHNSPRPDVPAPEPTARYGAFLARGCAGCHGDGLSGGPIPGAPASMAIPLNLTMHESGLKGWTKEQFIVVLNTGILPDGRKLDPFMPIETTRNMNDVERSALWAYLQSLPPTALGNR